MKINPNNIVVKPKGCVAFNCSLFYGAIAFNCERVRITIYRDLY